MELSGTTSSAASALKDSEMLTIFDGVPVKSANGNQLTPFDPLTALANPRLSHSTLTDDITFAQNTITEITPCSSQSLLCDRYPKDFYADSFQASPKFGEQIAEEIPTNAVSSSRPADISLTIETTTALKKTNASVRSSTNNKWSSVWERFCRVFNWKKSKMDGIHDSEEMGMVAINMEEKKEEEEEEQLSESDESVYFDESSDSDDYKWERITKFSQMKEFLRHRRS